MDNNKIICSFKSEKKYFYDYFSENMMIKVLRYLSLIFLPICAAILVCAVIISSAKIFFIAVLAVAFFIFNLFGYLPLVRKIFKRNTVSRYGSDDIENVVAFEEDEIVIQSAGDKAVIPYKSIKRIVDCGSVYAIYFSKTGGTYFAKNCCNDYSDAEILDFLKRKTGITPAPDRHKKQKSTGAVLSVLSILISASFVVFIWFCCGSYTLKGGESMYESYYSAENYYGGLGESVLNKAGDYDKAHFQIYKQHIGIIFSSEAAVLKLDYSDDEYNKQKEYVLDNFDYLQEPVIDEAGDYLISQNEFTIGSWCFKVCESEGYTYPDCFRTIAYNDYENSIAYIDFFDSDLDFLCEDFEPMEYCFVDEYVGYNFKK